MTVVAVPIQHKPDTYDTAAALDSDKCERDGLAILGQYPAVVAKLVDMAERAAGRNSDYGDVIGEAVSLAVAMLARTVGVDGMPVDETDRAILVAATAKRAAGSAREQARRQWAPRGTRDAVDVDPAPPTSLGRWTNDKLTTRAERYTMGSLSATAPTVTVRPVGQVSPTQTTVTVQQWSDATVPTSYQTTHVHAPRVLAAAVIDQRDVSSLPRVIHGPRLGNGACKTSAPAAAISPGRPDSARGTALSAESTYWREQAADQLATALECAFALSGVDLALLTSPDGPEIWSRRGGIHWDRLATATGLPRGTVQYRVRQAARAADRLYGTASSFRAADGRYHVRRVSEKAPTSGHANP